jgi:hypothetical protein
MDTSKLLITPDFDATVDVDPEFERLNRLFENAETPEIAEKAKADLAEYQEAKGERPRVTIGYLPTGKVMEVSCWKHPEEEQAQYKSIVDQYREICRHGVRGWNLKPMKFEIKDKMAGDRCLDVLQMRSWLIPVGAAILDYNRLNEDQKKS